MDPQRWPALQGRCWSAASDMRRAAVGKCFQTVSKLEIKAIIIFAPYLLLLAFGGAAWAAAAAAAGTAASWTRPTRADCSFLLFLFFFFSLFRSGQTRRSRGPWGPSVSAVGLSRISQFFLSWINAELQQQRGKQKQRSLRRGLLLRLLSALVLQSLNLQNLFSFPFFLLFLFAKFLTLSLWLKALFHFPVLLFLHFISHSTDNKWKSFLLASRPFWPRSAPLGV